MTDIKNEEAGEKKSLNFIEQAVEKDLKEGKNGGKVQTRFPPARHKSKTAANSVPLAAEYHFCSSFIVPSPSVNNPQIPLPQLPVQQQ